MSLPTPGGAALIAIALWHADLLSGLTAVVSHHNVDSVALWSRHAACKTHMSKHRPADNAVQPHHARATACASKPN